MIASLQPAASVVTIGRPQAAASIRDLGIPSVGREDNNSAFRNDVMHITAMSPILYKFIGDPLI